MEMSFRNEELRRTMQVSENSQLTYGITSETIKELLHQNKIKKLSKQDVASRL